MKRSRTREELLARMRGEASRAMPSPAGGQTVLRHRRLMDLGREDLSLARLAEAHWDALAILAEAGKEPVQGALYGVWAAEMPGGALRLERDAGGLSVSGRKMFCSGAGLVDRALLTVGLPQQQLVDVDVRSASVAFDTSGWHSAAFALTNTAAASFDHARISEGDLVGQEGWYLRRPGFWHGACGPAACWAGGAISLVEWAMEQKRDDPHTLAHLGAMQAARWGLEALLDAAGREIDAAPANAGAAHLRASKVRHLVEQAATDILRRIPRAFGPYPLALVEPVAQQYAELDLYLRQSHAERDLEALGRSSRAQAASVA